MTGQLNTDLRFQQVQGHGARTVRRLALQLDLDLPWLAGEVAHVAARVEDGDLAPRLGLLGPLAGVRLEPGQVVRQVEVAQVDDGLAARPLAPRLLVVLVHLLAVAKLVFPPARAAIQAVVPLEELLHHARVHQRLEGLPVGRLPLGLLHLLDGLLDGVWAGGLLVRVPRPHGSDLYLDLARLVARAPVRLQHALRPQLEAVHLQLLQPLGPPRLVTGQGRAGDQILLALGRAVTLNKRRCKHL